MGDRKHALAWGVAMSPAHWGSLQTKQPPHPSQQSPCSRQVPFPAPVGTGRGTGLQERFNKQHWPPQAGFCCLLPRDPNQQKHQGGTESSVDLQDTGCSYNRFPICSGTASSNCPFPAHRAGLGRTTYRHPAAGVVWQLLSAATGGLRQLCRVN